MAVGSPPARSYSARNGPNPSRISRFRVLSKTFSPVSTRSIERMMPASVWSWNSCAFVSSSCLTPM